MRMGEAAMKKLLSFLLALVLCAGLSAPALAEEVPDPGFSDVPSSHYAYSSIAWCASTGVASSYDDGTFRPGEPVTRAQFCVMLARVFFPEEVANQQAQTAGGPWYLPYVNALAKKGILIGTGWRTEETWVYRVDELADWALHVEAGITRYEMAQLLYNIMAANYRFISLSEQHSVQGWIPDWDMIPARYSIAVAGVYVRGIVTGRADRSFGGAEIVNRAQSCVVVDRLARYLGVPVAPL